MFDRSHVKYVAKGEINFPKLPRQHPNMFNVHFLLRLQTLQRLKSHMKLHEEEKPFICDVCGKRYHDQNAVKLHMVGHLEVLPFPCTYCDKRFRHKGLLNVRVCKFQRVKFTVKC